MIMTARRIDSFSTSLADFECIVSTRLTGITLADTASIRLRKDKQAVRRSADGLSDLPDYGSD
jgi:orotate phosphoribosyltransferase